MSSAIASYLTVGCCRVIIVGYLVGQLQDHSRFGTGADESEAVLTLLGMMTGSTNALS